MLPLILCSTLLFASPGGPATGPAAVRLLDVTGDGLLDQVTLAADGSLSVAVNVGSKTFLPVHQDLPRVPVTDLLVSDLDEDGLPDLYLVSPHDNVALLGDGSGDFREATGALGLEDAGPGKSAERVDVDGDGLDDLLLHNVGGDVLFWATAPGRYERGPATPTAADPLLMPTELSPELVDLVLTTLTAPGGGRSTNATVTGSGGASGLSGGGMAAAQPGGASPPSLGMLDERFVNDDAGEVDGADIMDGSLTGADVSTSSGDVTFGGGATVTADQGVFGVGSVASGGSSSTVGGGYFNTALGYNSTVGGGSRNTASGNKATVGGGGGGGGLGQYSGNTASGHYSTVSGGGGYGSGTNLASGNWSTIGGGGNNTATGKNATVSGGRSNHASGESATVGGGYSNTASGKSATVGGGGASVLISSYSYAFLPNEASGNYATVSGGAGNVAGSGKFATVGGGRENAASSYATVGGGRENAASNYDTVGGGLLNTASGGFATVGGGADNVAAGSRSTVGGGDDNEANGSRSTVGGGLFNRAFGQYSTVGGGYYNKALGGSATVSGGIGNDSGYSATVGGGKNNTAAGDRSTVGGGNLNLAAGDHSAVPGGRRNKAYGAYSFAAGRRAEADHDGSFVWGDSRFGLFPVVTADKTSSAPDQFNVYASGGTRIFSNTAATAGVLLAPGGNSWSAVSDRDAKEHLEPVDPRAVLEAVASLPIATWNYKSQDDAVRHMGPMAQDFHAAFGLGVSEKLIDTIDPDGVALAAIQGLNERDDEMLRAVAEKDAEIVALTARLEAVEVQLAELLQR